MSDKVCVKPLESVHIDAELEAKYLAFIKTERYYEDNKDEFEREFEQYFKKERENSEEHTEDYREQMEDLYLKSCAEEFEDPYDDDDDCDFDYNNMKNTSTGSMFTEAYKYYVRTMKIKFNSEECDTQNIFNGLQALKYLKKRLQRNYTNFASYEDALYEKLCKKRKNGEKLTIKEGTFMYVIDKFGASREKIKSMEHFIKTTNAIDKCVEYLEHLEMLEMLNE